MITFVGFAWAKMRPDPELQPTLGGFKERSWD